MDRIGPIPPITDERTAEAVRAALKGYEDGLAVLPDGSDLRAGLERHATELRTRLVEWEHGH